MPCHYISSQPKTLADSALIQAKYFAEHCCEGQSNSNTLPLVTINAIKRRDLNSN